MSVIAIENDELVVKVKTKGAELCGIYSKALDKEFMWQPGYELWDHSSLFLFPNVARVKGDRSIIGGKVYPQRMQGFAKDMEFEVVKQKKDRLVLGLKPNAETRASFPFEFGLKIDFRLEGGVLKETFIVKNKDNKEFSFGIGSHPGFYMPLELGEKAEDYVLKFASKQTLVRNITQKPTMLRTSNTQVILNDADELPLYGDIFNDGALLIDGINTDSVTLLSKKSGRFVEVGIKGFTHICFWGNPVNPYLCCIEPWCSTSDHVNSNQVWDDRPGNVKLPAGDTFERTMTFRVG